MPELCGDRRESFCRALTARPPRRGRLGLGCSCKIAGTATSDITDETRRTGTLQCVLFYTCKIEVSR